MELRYEIPEHLKGFIGNIPEPQLCSLITMLFEYAIQHRMLEYPRTEVEENVEDIKNMFLNLQAKQSTDNAVLINMLASMQSSISSLHIMMSGGQMPTIPVANMQPMMYMMPQQQGQYLQPQPMNLEIATTVEEETYRSEKVEEVEVKDDTFENIEDGEELAFLEDVFK